MSRQPEWTFSQRRHTDGQQAYKTGSILLIMRETQVKTNEISPYTYQNGYREKDHK